MLLADLNARHIDFLVNQTGIERQRIEWAALAARSARDMTDHPTIPLAMFYAWFRLDTEPSGSTIHLHWQLARYKVEFSRKLDLEEVARKRGLH